MVNVGKYTNYTSPMDPLGCETVPFEDILKYQISSLKFLLPQEIQ